VTTEVNRLMGREVTIEVNGGDDDHCTNKATRKTNSLIIDSEGKYK